jgi:hypothetical protein
MENCTQWVGTAPEKEVSKDNIRKRMRGCWMISRKRYGALPGSNYEEFVNN